MESLLHATEWVLSEVEREIQDQEESLPYSEEDLEQGWEFKIVRGHIGAFRSNDTLQHLVDQEARAGWIMLEKFDDSRVRFKRPVGAKASDILLSPSANPYRTNLISPTTWLVLIIALGVLVGLGACALLSVSLQ